GDSMTKPLRAAILGCGGIGRAHAGGYRRAGIPVVAAADVAPEGLAAFCDQNDIAGRFADYRELLEQVRPELVSVCTWPPIHEEMVIAAADCGARAIACEKPLTTSLGSAKRMLAACREHGVTLVVGHQRRYNPSWLAARDAIQQGRIGVLERIVITLGGDLLTDGVHGLNLALFWAGDPEVEWVAGQIDRRGGARERLEPPAGHSRVSPYRGWRYGHAVESGSVSLTRLAGGVQVHMETGSLRSSKVYFTLIAHGSEGFVSVDTAGSLRLYNAAGLTAAEYGDEGGGDPFRDEMVDLARVVQGELAEHPLDVRYHLPALSVVMAIYESSRRRAPVAFPFELDESPLEAMIAAGEA
ncbi:MAG TPA: Gfo/Idh/MocA family oxidoreductase, partial [Limnochordia bacterium]|nr:Gfo/Idh/MocA family oxidoreductase [Limnochordia bacterium]